MEFFGGTRTGILAAKQTHTLRSLDRSQSQLGSSQYNDSLIAKNPHKYAEDRRVFNFAKSVIYWYTSGVA